MMPKSDLKSLCSHGLVPKKIGDCILSEFERVRTVIVTMPRSILKTKTHDCDPRDCLINADAEVSLQYAKANAHRNRKIFCSPNAGQALNYQTQRNTFVRFSDEAALSPDDLAMLMASHDCQMKLLYLQTILRY